MEPLTVGIREFREKLARYLLRSDRTVTITRNGDVVGYYLPARPKPSKAKWEAFEKATARLQEILAEEGLTEDEVVEDFKRWRASRHK